MLLSDLVDDQVNYHNASTSDQVYQTMKDLRFDIFSGEHFTYINIFKYNWYWAGHLI